MIIRASDAFAVDLCPGKLSACANLVSTRIADPVRDSGTRIHNADAGEPVDPPLDRSEQRTLESIQEKRAALSEEHSGLRLIKIIRERLFENKMFSGHPDIVELWEMPLENWRAQIWDSKTGFIEQSVPQINKQLLVYAFLVFLEFSNVDEVISGLIPSRFKVPIPVLYSRRDLPSMEASLLDIWDRAHQPNAPRNPGPACRYCAAYGTSKCPETCHEVATVESAPLELSNIKAEDAPAVLETLRRVALRADEGIKAMTDYKLAHPEAWPTLAIVPGATKSHVPNAEVAYGALSDLVTASEFAGVCKVGVGDLKDLIETKIRAKEGIKGKALGARLKDILAPITATKQDRPRLAAVTTEKQIQ